MKFTFLREREEVVTRGKTNANIDNQFIVKSEVLIFIIKKNN